MGSSETELRRLVADLSSHASALGQQPATFLGTFDKRFPGFISEHRRCVAIVNTAGRETGGQHWLSFAWEPSTRTVHLFDPFGFSDAGLRQTYQFEYDALLKRSAIASTPDRCVQLVKSEHSVPGPHSAACGLFCCLFIAAFNANPQDPWGDANPVFGPLKGVPNAKLEAPESQPVLKANQDYLYRYLAQNSPYFRHNRQRFCEATAFDKLLQSPPTTAPP